MQKKIKILYISHSSYFNGAEICLLNLVKNIDRKLFEPIVVFPSRGPLLEEIKKYKIKTYKIKTYVTPLERWIRYTYDKPVPDINLKTRVETLTRIIEKESADIVHTNTSVIIEGAIAAKIKNIPHVWHIHEYLKGHPELNLSLPVFAIYEIMSYLSSKIISVSEFVKEQFSPVINLEKFITIYNGVEENKSLRNNLLREDLGIKNDELIAVAVGQLTEAKGCTMFLEAASLVLRKGLKIKFLWVGSADKKALRNFKIKRSKLGLKGSVIYLGFRSDIPDILKNSDFLICPSTMETLSLAILEGMAAGLPVITTSCGGPTECVIDNVTGLVVPINDSIKLSESIIEIGGDEQKRKSFGGRGLKRFIENFSVRGFTEKFEDLYKVILNDNKSKAISVKERTLIESSMKMYEILSDNHWKTMTSQRR